LNQVLESKRGLEHSRGHSIHLISHTIRGILDCILLHLERSTTGSKSSQRVMCNLEVALERISLDLLLEQVLLVLEIIQLLCQAFFDIRSSIYTTMN